MIVTPTADSDVSSDSFARFDAEFAALSVAYHSFEGSPRWLVAPVPLIRGALHHPDYEASILNYAELRFGGLSNRLDLP